MKRKSQWLFAVLAVMAVIAALAVTLVACGDKPSSPGGTVPGAHEHSYTLVEAKQPTCTEGGNEAYYVCEECDKYFNSGKQQIDAIPTLPARGHGKVTTTWETDGTFHWHKCNNCSEKLDIASHELGGYVEDSAATCKQKATHHLECSVCDYETQPEEYGDFGEHEYSRTDAQSPTCTEDGYEEYYTCDLCQKYFDSGKQQIDDIPTIPARGHDKVEERWETDGTFHWHECNNCDTRLDLDSHDLGVWIYDDVEATCLQRATRHKECPICGYRTESEEYGDFGEHNYNLTEAKDPTCTEDGNEEYYTCDVCGNYFDAQHQPINEPPIISASGHSKVLDSWETDGASHWHKCLNCEEKFDFDSHDFSWVEDKQATCLLPATHHQKCSVCYYETQPEEYGDLAAHKYGKTEAKAPTCTEDGNEEYYTCDVCGNYFDAQYEPIEDIPLLPARHDEVTDSWETDGASHWHKCNNCDEKLEFDEHEFGEWTIDNADYTCGDTVTRHRDCPTCGYSQKEDDYIVPHTWNSENQCDTCGKVKPYIEAGEKNKLFFGEYPQTNVTNDSTGLIATLSQMAGDRPVKGNRGKWTDYGYYMGEMQTGSAAKPVKTEYMWYIDLEYGGAKYRGVYFTSYRPDSTYTFEPSPTTAYQSKNGYTKDYVHWFKWEPIKWRVLTSADGEAFLMSDVILDSQPFYHDTGIRKTDDGMTTIYSNNYKESDIRAWLNKEFYEWAFDTTDQSIIKQTLVDNSPATTDSAGKNQYTCEDTLDYVFLLSYSDVTNPNYIPQDPYPLDKNLYCGRALNPTDYAESQGLSVVNNATNFAGYQTLASWWLRSPFNGDMSHLILNKGNIMTGGYVAGKTINTHWIGVVPALWITL